MRRLAVTTDAPPPYYNVEQWYLPSIALSADGALALTREVVLSSGVVFLEALLADVDPREAAPTEDPKRKLVGLA